MTMSAKSPNNYRISPDLVLFFSTRGLCCQWSVFPVIPMTDPWDDCVFAYIRTWNPKQPFINGCLVKQPFSIKIWNHPIETSIKKRLFRVPGKYNILHMDP